MANGGFLINNIAGQVLTHEDASIKTVPDNATADGYDVKNLVNSIPSETFRSVANAVHIDLDLGEVREFSAFSLINVREGASVVLKLFSASDYAEANMTWSINLSSRVCDMGGYKNLFQTFAKKSARYIRLELSGAGSYIELGEIFIGDYFDLIRNYSWGFSPVFRSNHTATLINGQLVYSQSVSQQHGYNMTFDMVPQSEYLKFKELFKPGMIVFAPDMAATNCFHGGLLVNEFAPSRQMGYDSFSLEFWENGLNV